ncbi:MAG: hypothetical protein II016_00740 [Erysipelotrichaceae bacterium]|nr:hypothetical protein [Erysipelotrichaceae bacterium]
MPNGEFEAKREELLGALDDPARYDFGKYLVEVSDKLKKTISENTYKANTKDEIWALGGAAGAIVLEVLLVLARNGHDELLGYGIIGLGIIAAVFFLFAAGIGGVFIVLVGMLILLILLKLLMLPLIFLLPVAAVGLLGYYFKNQMDLRKAWEEKQKSKMDEAVESFHGADSLFRKRLLLRAGALCASYRKGREEYRDLIDDLYAQFAKKHSYEAVDSKLRDGKAVEDARYKELVSTIRKQQNGGANFLTKFGNWEADKYGGFRDQEWWICPQGNGEYLAVLKTPQTADSCESYEEMDRILNYGYFNSMLLPWERRLFSEDGFFLLSADEAEKLGPAQLACRASKEVMDKTQVDTEIEMGDYSENCWYWLRDDAGEGNRMFVDGDGKIHREGHRSDFHGFAVRPAGRIVL